MGRDAGLGAQEEPVIRHQLDEVMGFSVSVIVSRGVPHEVVKIGIHPNDRRVPARGCQDWLEEVHRTCLVGWKVNGEQVDRGMWVREEKFDPRNIKGVCEDWRERKGRKIGVDIDDALDTSIIFSCKVMVGEGFYGVPVGVCHRFV